MKKANKIDALKKLKAFVKSDEFGDRGQYLWLRGTKSPPHKIH